MNARWILSTKSFKSNQKGCKNLDQDVKSSEGVCSRTIITFDISSTYDGRRHC